MQESYLIPLRLFIGSQINRLRIGVLPSLLAFVLAMWSAVVLAEDWSFYGGDPGGSRFSTAQQITPENASRLQLAWQMRTGDLGEDFADKGHSFQATPVLWNGMLFVSTSANWVVAVDAGTGEQLWRFDPQLPKDADYSEHASRGVSLWHGAVQDCPDRVFIGTLVGDMHAVDARTGSPCQSFGKNGVVDLGRSVGEQAEGDYAVTSPPVLVGDLLIIGSAIGDNRAVESERGVVRALSAITGAEVWRWDPVPRVAADPAHRSWGKGSAENTGAANAWPPLSVDLANNLVFVPTSSPSPDFYGGERPGDNRYANSIVALNASDGSVRWYQQLVHHDVWDYDNPAQPVAVDLHLDGITHPALVVVTKTAMMFVFNRLTGEPIVPIEERPVPTDGVPGEVLSATQPFSTLPPLADQSAITEDDAFGVLWFDKRACQKVIRESRSQGIFTPQSLQTTLMNPGYAGGVNWGGVAVDPTRGLAVTNVNQLPTYVRLIPRDEWQTLVESGEYEEGQASIMIGTPYVMVRDVFLSPLGLPCTQPPWGKLLAMDLNTKAIRWELPFGSVQDLAPAIVPNFEWGVPNMGGPIVTESGVVFIGATADFYIRAYDIEDGSLLWKHRLPTGAAAVPMTYMHGDQQFVVIAVGGHSGIGLPRGDYVMAFALPSSEKSSR